MLKTNVDRTSLSKDILSNFINFLTEVRMDFIVLQLVMLLYRVAFLYPEN